MNNLGINFTADLQQAINDLPNTLTIGVRKYSCIADEERSAIEVEDIGRYLTFERTVHLVYSVVSAVPAIQDVVTLDSIKYWVADKTFHRESDTLILTLRRRDGGTTIN